jgi:hypothetical protein
MNRQKSRLRPLFATVLAAAQAGAGLWGLVPASAFAQTPPPRVWVGPMQADDVPGARLLSEKFDEATRDQLRRSQKVETTEQGKVGKISAGDADPRVEEAERLRVSGKELFAQGKHEEAIAQLKRALVLYEEGLASVGKLEAVAETLGYLGATAMALGYDGDARDYFRNVIAMMPGAEPLDEFPDETKAFFAKTKKKLLKKKKGGLKIVTEPPGATVRVDGEERGKSPLTVKGLVRGNHYVQAYSDAAGLASARVRVKGKGTKEVNLTLATEVGPEPAQKADATLVADLNKLARANDLSPEFREKAEAIGTQTRAACVVVGSIVPQGNNFVLTPYVYGMEEKQVAAMDQFKFRADLSSVFTQSSRFAQAVEEVCNTFPFDKVVTGKLVAAAPVPAPAPDPPATEPRPSPREIVKNDPKLSPEPAEPYRPSSLDDPEQPPDDDDDEAWYAAWWVWTLAGAAVIGGTAYAGYVLLQDDDGSDSYDATVVW